MNADAFLELFWKTGHVIFYILYKKLSEKKEPGGEPCSRRHYKHRLL